MFSPTPFSPTQVLPHVLHRAARIGLAAGILLSVCSLGSGVAAPEAQAASLVNGSGSTYVALAMDEWTRASGVRGIKVIYNGLLGSPAGVGQYDQRQVDFAGTEAEVRSLYEGKTDLARGYQYVPDVAGAIAIMYNVRDAGGNKVTTLHLDQRTISKIFTGSITRWSDPAITKANGGKALPNQAIRVVYRSSQSGTTALFYDFVREAARDVYEPWRRRLDLPDRRIIELPNDPVNNKVFAPNVIGRTSSDAIASFIDSSVGLWSIGYDEFGYAVKYGVPSAWVQNGAGQWVQPFAENIAEALKDADLRPDLTQELSKVYVSKRPKAYPISAYSYVMTQCVSGRGRATCKEQYSDGGKQDTLAQFMRFVACDGQVKMARIGYSPLPPNLSQEMVNSVARMTGGTAERLTRNNCANPTFFGSLGSGAQSPPDPFAGLPGGVAGITNGGTGGSRASAGPSATVGAGANGPGAVEGGSGRQQETRPVSFNGPIVPGLGALPALVLLAMITVPPTVMVVNRWIRRRGQQA